MRFLLIEDHPLMRSALKQLLATRFPHSSLDEAADAASAMKLITEEDWTLIMVDIDLPDRSGLDLLADIRVLSPQSRVLVLSGQDEMEFGQRVIKAGASGFIGKLSSTEQIMAAIQRVLSGKIFITSDLASSIVQSALTNQARLPHELLSQREFEVFRFFGQGYSNSDIGEKLGISIKTVSTYRSRILEKMNLKTTSDIVRYAVKNGLA
jgi:DNA-binding NarL/FixJ family response regulator